MAADDFLHSKFQHIILEIKSDFATHEIKPKTYLCWTTFPCEIFLLFEIIIRLFQYFSTLQPCKQRALIDLATTTKNCIFIGSCSYRSGSIDDEKQMINGFLRTTARSGSQSVN